MKSISALFVAAAIFLSASANLNGGIIATDDADRLVTFKGVVVDSAGKPIAKARVSLEILRDNAKLEFVGAVTDEAGMYVFRDVPITPKLLSKVRLRAYSPGHNIAQWNISGWRQERFSMRERQILSPDQTEIVADFRLTPSDGLTFTVVDSMKQPVSGASLARISGRTTNERSVSIGVESWIALGLAVPKSDSSGRFQNLPFDPDATWEFQIEHPDYAVERFRSKPNNTTFTLKPGKEITVKIECPSDPGEASNATVFFGESLDRVSLQPNPQGECKFRVKGEGDQGVSPRRINITHRSRLESPQQRFDPKLDTYQFQLYAPAIVTGRVVDRRTGAPVPNVGVQAIYSKPLLGKEGSAYTGEDGTFEIRVADGQKIAGVEIFGGQDWKSEDFSMPEKTASAAQKTELPDVSVMAAPLTTFQIDADGSSPVVVFRGATTAAPFLLAQDGKFAIANAKNNSEYFSAIHAYEQLGLSANPRPNRPETLETTTIVKVLLVSESGKPIPNAFVRARSNSVGGLVTTNQFGEATFDNLPPDIEYTFSYSKAISDRNSIATQTFTPQAGLESIQLTIPDNIADDLVAGADSPKSLEELDLNSCELVGDKPVKLNVDDGEFLLLVVTNSSSDLAGFQLLHDLYDYKGVKVVGLARNLCYPDALTLKPIPGVSFPVLVDNSQLAITEKLTIEDRAANWTLAIAFDSNGKMIDNVAGYGNIYHLARRLWMFKR